jgi:hypothetical protein
MLRSSLWCQRKSIPLVWHISYLLLDLMFFTNVLQAKILSERLLPFLEDLVSVNQ